MSELSTTLPPEAAEPPSGSSDRSPHLGWAVAGLSAAAGVIHLVMVPAHAGGSALDPIGFAVAGWFQLLVAAAILTDRGGRNLYRAAVVGNLVLLGLWLWSRTTGLPFGSHAGEAEDAGLVDGVTVALQVGIVILSARLLMASEPKEVARGRLGPALLAVGALGLASVALLSDDATSHGHDHDDAAAAPADPHAALMAEIDAERCDTDFNIPAYWDEADYLGIDTYQGGAMSPDAHSGGTATTSSDGHSHGAAAAPAAGPTTTTEPDPTSGRGSEALDDLISLTDASSGGEGAAAALVTELSEASDEDYDVWLWWLKSTGMLTSHADHGSGGEDGGGHGGHVGPQPWVAMTDPAECAELAEELEIARDTALKYPTAADATEAGWIKVTPYLSGIAAHYIKPSLIDGKFEVDQPEMLLYDGNEPDASIVGLSYYLWHDGDLAPTSGFTGQNDHGHRHIGLCTGPGGVIGDSTTTEEECEARGGFKASGSKGWMSHAWVVPGCESPWGVFSAASPVLDQDLKDSSGTDGGNCAGSGVRDRYGLTDVTDADPASTRTGG